MPARRRANPPARRCFVTSLPRCGCCSSINTRRAGSSTEFCIQHFTDPEPLYYMARHLVQLGEPVRALGGAEHSLWIVGFFPVPPR